VAAGAVDVAVAVAADEAGLVPAADAVPAADKAVVRAAARGVKAAAAPGDVAKGRVATAKADAETAAASWSRT
jgi:hypothetical protein